MSKSPELEILRQIDPEAAEVPSTKILYEVLDRYEDCRLELPDKVVIVDDSLRRRVPEEIPLIVINVYDKKGNLKERYGVWYGGLYIAEQYIQEGEEWSPIVNLEDFFNTYWIPQHRFLREDQIPEGELRTKFRLLDEKVYEEVKLAKEQANKAEFYGNQEW